MGGWSEAAEHERENQKQKHVKSSLIMLFSLPPVPTARANVGNIRIFVETNFQITHKTKLGKKNLSVF